MNVIAVLVTFALLVAGCANTGSSPRTASSQDLSSSQQDRLMSEIKREKAVAARTEDPVARSNQLMLVGHYELMLENLPSGLQYYEKARQLRMDAGEIAMARESTYAMASALSLHGKLEQAMVQLEQDPERYGEPDKASGSAKVHQLLARLYVDTGRFEKGARSARNRCRPAEWTASAGRSGRYHLLRSNRPERTWLARAGRRSATKKSWVLSPARRAL
ncbi:MAG: hypothetical protein M5U09_01725 [Gammaproteobacteria bacterium]|nr:hypothetical protein [Gammaproteobacteria bacterium]